MTLLLILYPLIILALVGVAIYQHMSINILSLPIPSALTILTILLPLLSPLTTLTAPSLSQPATRARSRNHNPTPTPRLPPLLPPALHLLQFLLTTILATLFTAPLTSPDPTTCLLSTRWRALWSAHNASAIRQIQDALVCCGFRSTRDMAWPFPRGQDPSTGPTCEQQFGRREPCLPGWEAAFRRANTGEIAVVACVGVMQVAAVVLAWRFGGDPAAEGGWGGGVRGLLGVGDRGGREGVEGSRRPLLVAASPVERAGEGVVETGYQEVMDGEEASDGEGEGDGEERQQRRGPNGYGGVGGGGPRVEPAHHDPWAGIQRV
ncbi:hypothetical protein C8A05DRAFT_44289 [Staphylotrichum tortipilum]|uniref:Uncharacterized protein n=1 Tax=Staphylotrichum tortipilum TaxID=2831512 RepID=A0AAN6RTJ2_9PEZI|nr:hypothetical protein C8A05DRAFT_44289 [Staphylotrichum longicolle]